MFPYSIIDKISPDNSPVGLVLIVFIQLLCFRNIFISEPTVVQWFPFDQESWIWEQ
jgi:hypothetical protein